MHSVKFKQRLRSSISLLALTLSPFLYSCSDSLIGQELADSFESPSNAVLEEDILRKSGESKSSLVQESKSRKKIIRTKPKEKTVQLIKPLKEERFFEKEVSSFIPQPYRITIKLSGANPSAPAETVTKALRKAGVRFEVEKIERIEQQQLKTSKINLQRR